jgi:PncC family amidohydrolase
MNEAADLLSILRQKGLTIGSVESLTAGLFGSEFCSVPGASYAYKGGIITYANEIKEKLVSVSEDSISRYGVVSEEVAREMADGGLEALNVDVCVSFTGNAGPTSEPGEAVVGEVYMGLAFGGKLDRKTLVYHEIFKGSRNEIRYQCVAYMLAKADEEIRKSR